MKTRKGLEHPFEEYYIEEEPYYLPIKDEVEILNAAYSSRLPVLLKGPTGCGKTRFVEFMAYNLHKHKEASGNGSTKKAQLITVACHEDLTASDLVGRYLLEGEETIWIDGPLTKAVKTGAICYLDEIVEARKDTTVLIHPLADHRRILPIEKKDQIIEAHEDFFLVISYNPGYQSVFKDLKHSTRQRFISIEFDYPPLDFETEIIKHESGVDEDIAQDLARIGQKVRNLKEQGLEEGVSTRLLIYAGHLMAKGIDPKRSCEISITHAITDDREVQKAISEIVTSILP
ncbi:MAG: CbbQ/NirQ/NorQ/GpvN family protein [Candidatus Tectomicrobia bacterium]|uniref:CbbQ/NirQ/NorQ/GpvN family protein n=1 Tax=Tectimicrobiota bacterium TaxID=2528274 RepID=A0A933LPX3_UNCTE|nr:CbbQ/NirQ/NorQ/GpvN family protein [Candidatus Tectomicrobia bacterium]